MWELVYAHWPDAAVRRPADGGPTVQRRRTLGDPMDDDVERHPARRRQRRSDERPVRPSMTDLESMALPFLLTALAFAPITAFVATVPRTPTADLVLPRCPDRADRPRARRVRAAGSLRIVRVARRRLAESLRRSAGPAARRRCRRSDHSTVSTPLGVADFQARPAVPEAMPSIVRPFPVAVDEEPDLPAAVVTRARPSRAKARSKGSVDDASPVASRVGAARPVDGPPSEASRGRAPIDRRRPRSSRRPSS